MRERLQIIHLLPDTFFYQKNPSLKLNISSHLKKKIKQLKQSAGGRGDINMARHFGRLKEKNNIKFEKQSVVLWWTL